MTKEQWMGIYEREKAKNGARDAAGTLLAGMNREVLARAERLGPRDDASQVIRDVDAIWRHVAASHEELLPDGFKNFTVKHTSFASEFFE